MKPILTHAARVLRRLPAVLTLLALTLCVFNALPARSATVVNENMRWFFGGFQYGNGVYAFSTDRSQMAVGKGFGFISIYRMSDGSLVNDIYTGNHQITALAFSPGGSRIAASLQGGGVKIWRVSDGSLVRTITTSISLAIAYSPDGMSIAEVNANNVRLWDVNDGSLIGSFSGHNDAITALAFSANGAYLASGSNDHTVRVWDIDTRTTVHTFTGFTSIEKLSFSPDSGKLAINATNTIEIRNIDDWSLATSITTPGFFDGIEFSHDSGLLAYAETQFDSQIKIINTGDGSAVDTLTTDQNGVKALAFSLNDRYLTACGNTLDQNVKKWNLTTRLASHLIDREFSLFQASALSPDGADAVTVNWNGATSNRTIWNGNDGFPLFNFGVGIPYSGTIEYSPDGSIIAMNGGAGQVSLHDKTDGSLIRTLVSEGGGACSEITFSPDGLSIACVFPDVVNIWNLETGDLLAEFDEGNATDAVVFSPDNLKLVSLTQGNRLKYWLVDGSLIWDKPAYPDSPPAPGSHEDIIQLYFNPGGTQIASLVRNRGVRLYSSTNGAFVSEWHNDLAQGCLAQDWSVLAWEDLSGSNNINISSLSDHRLLTTLIGHSNIIDTLAFSSDAKVLLSVGNHEIALWDIPVAYQADLLIKASSSGAYIGDDLLLDDPTQRVDLSTSATYPAVYHVRLENDGANNDSLRLRGTAGQNGWSVRYFDALTGGAEITSQVTGTGWISTVAPNAYRDVRVEVKPDHSVAVGATLNVEVWANSQTYPATCHDRVFTTTTAVPYGKPDIMIKKHADAAFMGNGVYNLTGLQQTASISPLIDRAAVYDFSVQNDGCAADNFRITGPSGGYGWTVRYFKDFDDLAEITDDVTGAGWLTGMINVGATLAFHAEVTPDSTVIMNGQRVLLVSAASALFAGTTDVVKAVTTRAPINKPDLTIRNSDSAAIGAGVITDDGSGQTVAQSVQFTQTARYYINIVNRGEAADRFFLHGMAGAANWTVSYFDATGVNITAAVVQGTWCTAPLGVGGLYTIRAEVTPNNLVAPDASQAVLVTATSAADDQKTDTVQAVTTKLPLTSVSLLVAPTSGQEINRPVTLTAVPVGGRDIVYSFAATDPEGETTVLQEFEAGNSTVFIPTLIGNYTLTVWAREVGGPATATATLTYTVTEAILRGVFVTSEMQENKEWLFTATPDGGLNQQYKFRLKSGNTWTDLQSYGIGNTCRWRPIRTGTYTVRAYAKEIRNNRTVEFYTDQAFRVVTVPNPPPKLTAVRLEVSLASPQSLNTPITLTATPVGGTNIEYRFRVYNGSVWTDLRAFSSDKTVVWTPTVSRPKPYTLAVYAHEIGTSISTQVMTSITFIVQP